MSVVKSELCSLSYIKSLIEYMISTYIPIKHRVGYLEKSFLYLSAFSTVIAQISSVIPCSVLSPKQLL